MKYILPFILLIFITTFINPQVKVEKIFEKSYNQLPFNIRVENSGIYGIAKFDVRDDLITFSTYDHNELFQFGKSSYLGKKNQADYPVGLAPVIGKSLCESPRYQVIVENRDQLKLIPFESGILLPVTMTFEHNLAYSDIIGIDKEQNIYLIIEKYISDLPLKIKREVYCITREGKILSTLEIPPVKYLSTINDFILDKNGSLFHLYSDPVGIAIYKWNGLNNPSTEKVKYPFTYDENFSLEKYLPTTEPASEQTRIPNAPQALTSRNAALQIGDSYVLYRYECEQANLAPSDVTDPGGDKVRTSSWLVLGQNAKIPYKWGGFNTLQQFTDGIKSGRYAGDINTEGVSNYAVGVDCSGFVSRCWQLTYHSTTSDMPNITYQHANWDLIRPGDAVLKSGHVRMFVEKNANGSLRVVESSGRDWGVSYWTYTPSELSSNGYTPRYYRNMVSDYSLKRPELQSAVIADPSGSGTVKLTWNCDTAGILGYRIYRSVDGVNFSVLYNEKVIKTTSATFPMAQKTEYYRVSSVTDSVLLIESYWSAVMGVGNTNPSQKVLIVDGFEREGVWRGPGNPFLYNYGKALSTNPVNFETVKTSYLQSSGLPLNNYFAVYWLLGDESTEQETFNSKEQTLVKNYLENGGSLFVSGGEIAWDLDNKGTTDDKAFYHNYLKASYVSDNSNSKVIKSSSNQLFSGYSFNIGQTTPVDYPDEIAPYGGSVLCLQYANDKGAGVAYSGKFGTSATAGKVICLGFPLESTANDNTFNSMISRTISFFSNQVSEIKKDISTPKEFSLSQNYPNPFNPSTTISYSIPSEMRVTLKVFDVLGREAAVIVDEVKPAGAYNATFNSKLSSGVYFYRLQAGSFIETKQMIILK